MIRLSMTREQRRPVSDTGRLSYYPWPPECWAWSTGGRAWVHTGTPTLGHPAQSWTLHLTRTLSLERLQTRDTGRGGDIKLSCVN